MNPLAPLSLITALSAVALTGCLAPISIELPPAGERATVIEKLPLTVGVFYGPRFRTYTLHGCLERAEGATYHKETYRVTPCPGPGGTRVDVNIGDASVALFNRTMRALFAQVESAHTRRPTSLDSQALAAIIEPEFLEYGISISTGSTLVTYGVKITYRLVLRTPGNDELIRWSISGEAKEPFPPFTSVESGIRITTHNALRALEAKMLTRFHKQSEVKHWLSSNGITKTGSGRNDQ